MAIALAWINPGRLMRIQMAGAITQADFVVLRQPLQQALVDVDGKVDYLLDMQAVTAFPESLLRILLGKQGLARSLKTGRFLVVGANADARLVLESAALALRLELRHFDDMESALAFAAEG